jgi:amino acid transporter
MLKKLKRKLMGAPRDPMQKETRQHISLIALFAWIGLGADGLSSACYGPALAFQALGHHTYLALYLSILSGLTVFIIALAYNQVIELFPSGGGGYKVAAVLLGPYFGLISGTALLMGYVLTIAVSVATGVAAIFSLLPHAWQQHTLTADTIVLLGLMYLNLRGMKESIKLFMPIFLGFIVFHAFVIVYGILLHWNNLSVVTHTSWQQTMQTSHVFGWFFILALLLRGYSLGGGSYTGLEAISNNVNSLAEPRVRTGKWTMLYLAVSLSIMVGGILILYLLWGAHPVPGQTLNASTFQAILSHLPYGHVVLVITLALETGLLFVGANTGFLGGPAVLASMSIDGWVPRRFLNLSNRLVIQNGIFLFTIASILVLFWTGGSIEKLVILYATSVFITFSLSLLGICVYWMTHRSKMRWIPKLFFSILGFIICVSILVTIIVTRFTEGGWLALVVNGLVIAICLFIKKHYQYTKQQVKKLDAMLFRPIKAPQPLTCQFNPMGKTAVFFVGKSIGEGLHTLLRAEQMFQKSFKNMIFISVGVVDVNNYQSETTLFLMKQKIEKRLNYFVKYAQQFNIPAKTLSAYGTNPIDLLEKLAEKAKKTCPDCVFFAAKVVPKKESWFTRQLHNDTAFLLHRNLYLRGMQMIMIPVVLNGR